MLSNTNITIYNYWYNPKVKRKEYLRTIIEDVYWHAEQKVSVVEKGLVSADLHKIRIPEKANVLNQKCYVDSIIFQRMGPEQAKSYWTVNNGDLIVKGIVNEDIEKMYDLMQRYSVVAKVVSFSDNRIGLEPHIRIGGVS